MSEDMPDMTWDDGALTQDDVIEAADYQGYTSMTDYVDGVDGYAPDYSEDA